MTHPAVSKDKPGYPPLLRELYDPPSRLYLRGAPPDVLARPSVAVVGARSCSAYGAQVARELVRALAAAGVVVVSGLARGIDGGPPGRPRRGRAHRRGARLWHRPRLPARPRRARTADRGERPHRLRVAAGSRAGAVALPGEKLSYSSNLPLGNGMRDQALRRRYGDDGESDIAALAIRLYRDALHDNLLTQREIDIREDSFAAELTLEQVVRIESTQLGGIPQTLTDFRLLHDQAVAGAAVLRLVQALQGPRRCVVVTVNFDEVLEDAAGVSVKRFASDDEISDFPAYLARYLNGEEEAVPLLKLHGTISDPLSCIVNAEQTERGLPEHKKVALESIVGAEGGHRVPLIYIGASLRDVDVVPVLQSSVFATRSEEMWVAPFRGPSIDTFAHSRYDEWRRGGRDGSRPHSVV